MGDRRAVDEALRVKGVGAGEGVVADGGELLDLAVVDGGGGEEGEAAVAMPAVVPGEEFAAEGEGVGEGREAVGEMRAVLEVMAAPRSAWMMS